MANLYKLEAEKGARENELKSLFEKIAAAKKIIEENSKEKNAFE